MHRQQRIPPPQQSLFDAEISYSIYEGYGCGCVPIADAKIFATGGEGNDTAYTDSDGYAVLNLVIDGEYRVTIEAEGYQTIIYDFLVIDDQPFTFHVEEVDDDASQQVTRRVQHAE